MNFPKHGGCYNCGKGENEILTAKTLPTVDRFGRPAMPSSAAFCSKCLPGAKSIDQRVPAGQTVPIA
jgi:hypothetical protein